MLLFPTLPSLSASKEMVVAVLFLSLKLFLRFLIQTQGSLTHKQMTLKVILSIQNLLKLQKLTIQLAAEITC